VEDQEVLAIALEWVTNADGHLMARMNSRDEVTHTAVTIMANLGNVPDFERDFEAAAGQALSSILMALERQKIKILGNLLVPLDVIGQNKHDAGYIIRIFELKKHKYYWAADRQWSAIRLCVAELLRQLPRQPIIRDVNNQESLNRPAPQSPRYVRNDDDEGPIDVTNSSTKSQAIIRDDALIVWRSPSRYKGRHASSYEARRHTITQRARSPSRASDSDYDAFIDDGILVRPRHRRRRRRSMGDLRDHEPQGPILERLRLPETEDRPPSAQSQLIRGKVSPADRGMRTLFVFRAVLFAALGALAADTSCVYETELGRRIVQVL